MSPSMEEMKSSNPRKMELSGVSKTSKSIEFTREKPVIKEVVVEVPNGVIIEKPEREGEQIEDVERVNIVTKPVIREKTVDNIIEKVVERRVEVPREEIVEVLEEVPVHFERRIARPHRTEVRHVEVKESVPEAEQVIVEKRVPVHVDKYVEVEGEEARDVFRDFPVENVIY